MTESTQFDISRLNKTRCIIAVAFVTLFLVTYLPLSVVAIIYICQNKDITTWEICISSFFALLFLANPYIGIVYLCEKWLRSKFIKIISKDNNINLKKSISYSSEKMDISKIQRIGCFGPLEGFRSGFDKYTYKIESNNHFIINELNEELIEFYHIKVVETDYDGDGNTDTDLFDGYCLIKTTNIIRDFVFQLSQNQFINESNLNTYEPKNASWKAKLGEAILKTNNPDIVEKLFDNQFVDTLDSIRKIINKNLNEQDILIALQYGVIYVLICTHDHYFSNQISLFNSINSKNFEVAQNAFSTFKEIGVLISKLPCT